MYCMVQINSLFKREKNTHQNRVQVFTMSQTYLQTRTFDVKLDITQISDVVF